MHKFIVITIVLTIASSAMATNKIPAFVVKDPASLAYANAAAYGTSAHLPADYYYDARLNAVKHGYIPAGHIHAAPVNYILAHPVPPAFAPVSVHLAPAIPPFASYGPSHVLAHLEARHFIGRHFPKA